MSAELDRKIAIEVMGEPEPDYLPTGLHRASRGGNWRGAWLSPNISQAYEWQPLPFSSDFGEAMRVFEAYVARWKEKYPGWRDYPHEAALHLTRSFGEDREVSFVWYAGFGSYYGFGAIAAEAICRLLLSLVEET